MVAIVSNLKIECDEEQNAIIVDWEMGIDRTKSRPKFTWFNHHKSNPELRLYIKPWLRLEAPEYLYDNPHDKERQRNVRGNILEIIASILGIFGINYLLGILGFTIGTSVSWQDPGLESTVFSGPRGRYYRVPIKLDRFKEDLPRDSVTKIMGLKWTCLGIISNHKFEVRIGKTVDDFEEEVRVSTSCIKELQGRAEEAVELVLETNNVDKAIKLLEVIREYGFSFTVEGIEMGSLILRLIMPEDHAAKLIRLIEGHPELFEEFGLQQVRSVADIISPKGYEEKGLIKSVDSLLESGMALGSIVSTKEIVLEVNLARLQEADLAGVNLRGANLGEADLAGVNLRGANLQGANLQGANLREANLQEANLAGVNLRGANLQGANLQRALLWNADLHGAVLNEADLSGANISRIRHRAKLTGVRLLKANLQGAILEGANLQEANLREANLQGALLWMAILEGANLQGANLGEANLREALLSEETKYDSETLLPDGKHWSPDIDMSVYTDPGGSQTKPRSNKR